MSYGVNFPRVRMQMFLAALACLFVVAHGQNGCLNGLRNAAGGTSGLNNGQ